MNRELRRLLELAGYPDANEPDLWQRAVMFNNVGAIPRPSHHDRDYVWHGFHLLLVDRRGNPTHFAKCRSADDAPLERECTVLAILGPDPVLQRVIPQNRSASSQMIRLQLTRWLPGVTLERMAPGMEAGVWGEAVQTILERASLVSDRAAALLPDLLGPQPTIDLMAEATDHLTTLRREGIEPGLIDPIAAALADAPPVPRRLQHGDLWPGNIIHWEDDWWLLDFEAFGRVQVPKTGKLFVMQMHQARQLHWDLRLEIAGVLRSWAIPKGPSADTSDKRFAALVEDHPLDYANFEGHIPDGNYGAGRLVSRCRKA